MEGGGGTNQQGGNVTNSRKTPKHRQTKKQASGCRPVNQSASSTPAERQSGREASRAAEKPAERQKSQQTGIDQQNGKEASRTAKRPAEQLNSKS